jgi:GT2 family glycosyltransferase
MAIGVGHGDGISGSPEAGQAGGRLAVLVLSHDKRTETLRCLDSVARLRYRPRDVIVVDNGSSDGSADAIALAHPEVHLVRSAVNLGAAGGRNLGIREAGQRFAYDYLLFLDDDTVVEERLADELVTALRADPAAGVATPKAYRLGQPAVIASAGGMRVRLGRGVIADVGAGEVDRGQFDRAGPVDAAAGFALLARREVLMAVGGFDEGYNPYGWEEVDFSLRVRKAGFAIRYVPSAVVHHAGGSPGRGRGVAVYERGKSLNFLRLMRTYASPLEWAGFVLAAPVRAGRVLLRQVARGEWQAARARVSGFVEGLLRR